MRDSTAGTGVPERFGIFSRVAFLCLFILRSQFVISIIDPGRSNSFVDHDENCCSFPFWSDVSMPCYVMLASVYVPYTWRSASQISPTVAYARTASTIKGIVFAGEM